MSRNQTNQTENIELSTNTYTEIKSYVDNATRDRRRRRKEQD